VLERNLGKQLNAAMVQSYYNNGTPMDYYTCRHYPAGFISTDISDFSKFVIVMLNKGMYESGRVLKESTFEKMIDLQDSTSGTANLWAHCLGIVSDTLAVEQDSVLGWNGTFKRREECLFFQIKSIVRLHPKDAFMNW
jgi:hypothetical protein